MILKEIQGLRFISLIIILLFHLNIPYFEFGYLGVDIFFFISGFIFTKIIFSDIEYNRFSFTEYFIKRARRILPGLVITLIFVTVISWLYLIPLNLKYYGQSLLSSSVFLSNIYFFIANNDYFSPNSYSLLHLWSLSLEIQFYFIYPLLIIFFYKFDYLKKNISLILFIITIFSFLFSVYFGENEKLIFYFLPSRLWEFLIGYFVYDIVYKKKIRLFKKKNFYFFTLTLFLLIYLIFGDIELIKKQILTIYFISTIFFISFNKKNIFNFILTNSLAQLVAKYSYSVFLVHYPIIHFAKYFGFYNLEIKNLSLLLLIISFFSLIVHNIERQFFNLGNVKNLSKSSLKFFTSFLTFFFLIGFFFHYSNGIKLRYFLNNEINNIYISKSKKFSISKKINGEDCFSFCKKINGFEKSLLLFGDSHAGDLEFELTKKLKEEKINLYLSYFNEKKEKNLNALDKLKVVLKKKKIEYVFIMHHKKEKDDIYLKKIKTLLEIYPELEFYYFVPRVEFDESPIKFKILKKSFDKLNRTQFDSIDKLMRRLSYKNLIIVDQNSLLLEMNQKNCSTLNCFNGHDNKNFPIYRDNHHFSNYGSELFIKKLFKQLSLN